MTDKALEPYRMVVEDDDKAVRRALCSSPEKNNKSVSIIYLTSGRHNVTPWDIFYKPLTPEDLLSVLHSALK